MMNSIELSEDQVGCLCLVCAAVGEARVSKLLDPDLGPVCHECFNHCQLATVELLWQCAAISPSKP
jgi:hypothetical protein